MYILPHANAEITKLKFIDAKTELWLIGACWGGKLIIWQKPNEKNNFTINAQCRIGHKNDVISVE